MLGYELTTILWYFMIYSFLGWCVEVIYCTVTSGRVENRGFLDGPVCPIYGFGMLLVIFLIRGCGYAEATDCPLPLLFIGGMLLASSIELFAGWLMMKLFHMRWWDYTERPFNIGGYICLQFSICWGLASVGTIRFVHIPLTLIIEGSFFSGHYCLPMLIGCGLLYTIDFIMTVKRIAGINKSIARFEEVSTHLHELSEDLSQKLGNRALEIDQRIGEERVQGALAKAELLEHSKELRELAYRLETMKEIREDQIRKLKSKDSEQLNSLKSNHAEQLNKLHVKEVEQLTKISRLQAELEQIFNSFEGNRFLGIRKIMHIQRMRRHQKVQRIWDWHLKKHK